MRRLLVAFGLIGLVSHAFAADYELPTLRGSETFVPAPPTFFRWAGIYAGGQVGFGSAHMDFSRATRSLVAFSLRELALENEVHPSGWQVLGTADNGAANAGGFFGYNSQWDDLILGVEVNYSRTSYSANAPISPVARRTSAGGNVYDVTITGSASMHITDVATVRGRAGYVMGSFLPYVMGGVAFGRADVTRSGTASGVQNPDALPPGPPLPVPFTFGSSESKTGAFTYGWTAGFGVDVMVLPNVFVRGEYEFVSFTQLSEITASISTGRVGAAFKF
jgi:outer membrane immunogenic protein